MRRITIALAVLAGLAAPAAARDIVVSSKIDTEGGLLGNVILMALEHAGLPVQNRLQLGGTPIVRDAIAADPALTARQKATLLDVYESFVGSETTP